MQSSPPDFRCSVRIYFEDTDAGGIVYHANYLKYFERARTDWLRHAGVNQQATTAEHQTMFVLKSAQVDFNAAAKLDDELVITTVVEKLGRASMMFFQEAWRNDQCLVTGRFKVGCVEMETSRPCAIPEPVLTAIQQKYFPSTDQ